MLRSTAIAFGLAASGAVALAQRPAPPGLADSSVDRIFALAKRPGGLAMILRRTSRPQSPAKLDSLADRIAEWVVRNARSGNAAVSGADEVRTLQMAGARPLPGMEGIPYDGAVARLIRIHREAPAEAFVARASALRALPRVVGFDQGLVYLRDVAVSVDPTAPGAMRALINAATPGATLGMTDTDREKAVAVLRALWNRVAEADSAAVQDPPGELRIHQPVPNTIASGDLRRFAIKAGWARPGREGDDRRPDDA